MKPARLYPVLAALVVGSCATDGTVSGGFYYGGYYYDDPWYVGGGCCVDYPGDIGPPPPRPEHPIAKPPDPPLRGAYALATGGVFLMLGEEGAGGMVGARLGYRISTPIGLEFLFDYANNPIATRSGDSTVRLSSARFGGSVRLMSPGRKARFVASIGGGLAYNWLGKGESPGGVAFINLDTGFELDWSGGEDLDRVAVCKFVEEPAVDVGHEVAEPVDSQHFPLEHIVRDPGCRNLKELNRARRSAER